MQTSLDVGPLLGTSAALALGTVGGLFAEQVQYFYIVLNFGV